PRQQALAYEISRCFILPAEEGIRAFHVTGVHSALPISSTPTTTTPGRTPCCSPTPPARRSPLWASGARRARTDASHCLQRRPTGDRRSVVSGTGVCPGGGGPSTEDVWTTRVSAIRSTYG